MIGSSEKAILKGRLQGSEKMPTLVLTLIRAAAEQGASIKEFEDACEVATEVLRDRVRGRAIFSPEGDAHALLDGIQKELLTLIG